MPHFAILRVKKHSSVQNLIGSLKHNFREIKTPNANKELTNINGHFSPLHQCLVSAGNHEINSTKQAIKLFHDRLAVIQKNGAIRKNAVLAVEYLLTASPEWWENSTSEQRQKWRKNNMDFLIKKHGVENIIAATYQVDETTPHIAAFVIPEINGKLNARHFFGGRKKLSELQTEYANEMADLGLNRGIENSKAKHKTIKQYYSEIKNIFNSPVPKLALSRDIQERIKIPDKKLLENQQEYNDRIYRLLSQQVYEMLTNRYKLLKKINLDLKNKRDELVGLDKIKLDLLKNQQKHIQNQVEQLTANLRHELQIEKEYSEKLFSKLNEFQDIVYERDNSIYRLEDELNKQDKLLEQKELELLEQRKIIRQHELDFKNLREQLKATKQELRDLKQVDEPKKMDWGMNENDPF